MANEKLINVPNYSDFDADKDAKVDLSAGGLDIDLSNLNGILRVSNGAAYASSTMDHILDGSSYGRVKKSGLTAGHVLLATGSNSFDFQPLPSDSLPNHAARHEAGGADEIDHGSIIGLDDDDHPQYVLADGSRAFSGVVSGVTPIADDHLATKEYVDLAGVSRADFFWSDTASDVSGYNYAYAYETGDAESTIVSSALGEGDDQLIKGFITEAGLPGITSLPEGTITFRFNAKKGASNQRVVQLYCTLVRYESDTTETVIATSQLSEELTETEKHIRLVAVLNDPVALNITDRLVCKVYANVGAGAQDAVITLYMEGTTDSNFSTVAYTGIWQIHGDVLDDLNDLGPVTQDGEFLVGTGAGSFAWESGDTARTSLGLGSGNSPTFASLTLTGDLEVGDHAYFDAEFDNGNSGTTVTIDWTKGNKQKLTLTDDCTFTFVSPSGPCNLVLKLVQDNTGGRTVTWPASVKWPASTPPVLSTGANKVDIICFYFDGTNYYGSGEFNFS
ncbi:MAG: hypothetical protein ACTSUO_08560 [Candidatus Thorarchaeota archaeon]